MGFYNEKSNKYSRQLIEGVETKKDNSDILFTHSISVDVMQIVANYLLDHNYYSNETLSPDDLQYALNCHTVIHIRQAQELLFDNTYSKVENPITTIFSFTKVSTEHMALLPKLTGVARDVVSPKTHEATNAEEKELLERLLNAVTIMYFTANIQKIIAINS